MDFLWLYRSIYKNRFILILSAERRLSLRSIGHARAHFIRQAALCKLQSSQCNCPKFYATSFLYPVTSPIRSFACFIFFFVRLFHRKNQNVVQKNQCAHKHETKETKTEWENWRTWRKKRMTLLLLFRWLCIRFILVMYKESKWCFFLSHFIYLFFWQIQEVSAMCKYGLIVSLCVYKKTKKKKRSKKFVEATTTAQNAIIFSTTKFTLKRHYFGCWCAPLGSVAVRTHRLCMLCVFFLLCSFVLYRSDNKWSSSRNEERQNERIKREKRKHTTERSKFIALTQIRDWWGALYWFFLLSHDLLNTVLQ